MSVSKQGILLVAVPLCCSLVLLSMLYGLLSTAEQTAVGETRINEVLVKATQMFDLVEQAETTIRTAKDLKLGSLKTNVGYGPAPHSWRHLVEDLQVSLNTPYVLRSISDENGYINRAALKNYLNSGTPISPKVRATLSSLDKHWREFAADNDLDQDGFLRANGITFSSTPVSAFNLASYLLIDGKLLDKLTDGSGNVSAEKVHLELRQIQQSAESRTGLFQQIDVLVQLDNSYYALAGGEKLNIARLHQIADKYTNARQQSAAAMAYIPRRADDLLADFKLDATDSDLNKTMNRLTNISRDAMSRLHTVYDLVHVASMDSRSVAEELRQTYSGIRRDVSDMRTLLGELNTSHTRFVEQRLLILQRLKLLVAVGVVAMILVAVLSANFYSKQIARKLFVLTDNSKRVMKGEPLNAPLAGGDEISELDHVFHVMMSSLQEKTRRETSIIENAVDVICSIDKEGRFNAVSPSCLKSWGFSPDELIGKRYVALVVPERLSETIANFSAAQENRTNFMFENTLIKKDGNKVDMLWSGIWSEEDNSLFCVVHNISERKKVDRLKQEFVQMISHDLRSPLTSILTFLELIGDGFFEQKSERLKVKANTTVKDVERLLALVNNLLDVEKMESGKLESVREMVPLNSIIVQSVNSIRAIADRKEIAICAAPIDMCVYADANQITQIVVNLLSNAIKFSPKGSKISIDAVEDVGFAEISIVDEGRGVPEDLRSKIFDRFEQVEINDARVQGGSGLGLAICKAIIQAHGGSIGVDAAEKGGSRFWFRLPDKECAENIQF